MDKDAAIGLALIGAGIVGLWLRRGRKQTPGGGIVFVRAAPPQSHFLKNIIVLAVVVGLGWFFWYVMGTRCNGGC